VAPQSRGGGDTGILLAARFQTVGKCPSTFEGFRRDPVAVGRPRDRWVGKPTRELAFEAVSRPGGLRSVSAGLASSLLQFMDWGHVPFPNNQKEKRQNRRAPSTSAGEKAGCDERSRSEQTDFSPATGDSIACRSALNQRNGHSAQCSPLCVFAPLRGWRGGWLCVFWVGGLGVLSVLAVQNGRAGGLCVLCASVVIRAFRFHPCPTTRRKASSAR
jgi:hypothetical protein